MLRRSYKKSLKYITIGLTAFVVEFSVFALLIMALSEFDWKIAAAQVISFCCGLAISFLGNRTFTFKSKEKFLHSTSTQMMMFAFIASVNFILSSSLLYALSMLRIEPLPAKLTVIIIIALWNFTIFNHIIFRYKPRAKS